MTSGAGWNLLAALMLLGLNLGAVLAGEIPPEAVPSKDKGDKQKDTSSTNESTTEDDDLCYAASIEVDPDFGRHLARASELIDQKQFLTAINILQRILESDSRALVLSKENIYLPCRAAAECQLARLPESALKVYWLTVDGPAETLLKSAKSPPDAQILQHVVNRYYYSRSGDDACFLLASLHLDRSEFGAARDLLRKLLLHPDLSIPRKQILPRLCFASLKLGDQKGASVALRELKALAAGKPAQWAYLERETPGQKTPDTPVSGNSWPLSYGNALRNGSAPAFPLLSDVSCRLSWRGEAMPTLPVEARSSYHPYQSQAKNLSRKERIQQWKTHAWQPTEEVVFADRYVLISSHPYLYCYARKGGRLLWRSPAAESQTVSRHAWWRATRNSPELPGSQRCIWGFGNRLARALSISQSRVFRIENHLSAYMEPQQPQARRFQWGKKRKNSDKLLPPAGNHLAAYSLKDGRLLWRKGRNSDPASPFHRARFLSSPVLCDKALLVPVEQKDGIALAAIEAETGKVLWVRFLCAYVPALLPSWYPVGMTLKETELYITTGHGLVIAVDTTTGNIRWGAVYPTVSGLPGNDAPEKKKGAKATRQKMWNQNMAFISGDSLAVLAVDANQILIINRTTGQRLHQQPNRGWSYALGLHRNKLLLAGQNSTASLDIASGKLDWEIKTESSYGRGLLAGELILLPLENSILPLEVESGKAKSPIPILLPKDTPLGNLWADTERIFVACMDQIHVFQLLDKK